ncbi:J domain-containing protein [Enterococcus faecalis]|nr:J domain-containing protein [Enterococcus faecalis]
MKFIKDVTTLEELKRVYKKLALKYHPDMGGTDKEMAQINNEYEALFNQLKNTHKNKEGVYYQKETTETPQEWQAIIHKLLTLKMENVSIEVIGAFLWVSGNTKPYKEELKALNMKWSNNKKSWYLAPYGYKKRSKKKYDMTDIRNMYGSQVVKEEQSKQKTLTA